MAIIPLYLLYGQENHDIADGMGIQHKRYSTNINASR